MKLFALLLVFVLKSCNSGASEKFSVMGNDHIIDLVRKNDVRGVEKALKNGAHVNATDNQGRNLLLIATLNRKNEMAEMLVEHGADVNQQADNQDSPFLYAGASGQTELVKLFLKNGARFDIFNRYNGSALIPACEKGYVETVRILANTKGFPIDHINRLGWTALMEAIVLGDGSKKYQEVVQILKDAGSRLDIPDHEGITPLKHAQARGFKEIVIMLTSK